MDLWKAYHRPTSVREALRLLGEAPDGAAIIAGGTDLLLDMQQGRHPPVHTLVDISGIQEMREIWESSGEVFVGAGCTLAEIVRHPSIIQHAPSLRMACGLIGGPKIRNVATLGGNVAHALPAADGTIALLSLNAQAELVARSGSEWVPLERLFAGPGLTAFDRRGAILRAFEFPMRGPREGMAFRRVTRPQGLAIAILNMGMRLAFGEDDLVEDAQVSVGPAGPRPFRSIAVAEAMRGRTLDAELVSKAVLALQGEVTLRTSRHRATRAYREHLVEVLFHQTLQAVLADAGRDADLSGLTA
jgi:xanthine dehydrogenase FAD-binding subunit